jgi:hypothetical protein
VVDVDAKVRLEDLVDALGETICLRMEGSGEVGLGAKESDEGAPEGRDVERTTVGDDVNGDTMKANNGLEEHLSHERRVETFLGVWDEVSHLGEAIDEDHDRVETIGRRELDDGVHGDGSPRSQRDGERLKGTVWLVSRGLVAGTSLAAIDVTVDESTHAREVEVARGEVVCLLLTMVACKGVVVALLDNVEGELQVVRDVQDVGEVHKAIVAEGQEVEIRVEGLWARE